MIQANEINHAMIAPIHHNIFNLLWFFVFQFMTMVS
jgi:hypothetical protein